MYFEITILIKKNLDGNNLALIMTCIPPDMSDIVGQRKRVCAVFVQRRNGYSLKTAPSGNHIQRGCQFQISNRYLALLGITSNSFMEFPV